MPVKVEVKHSYNVLNAELNAVAQSVLAEFQSLPDSRLLSFFDDEDAPFFRRNFGQMNRGQFVVLKGTPTIEWPDYVTKHIYVCDRSLTVNVLFDHVVYLYGTTCADPVGRVMTFAHELQHFVQYGFNRTLWAESKLFWGLLPAYEIPTEREARVVAKCIAEKLCDPEGVKRYIARKIKDAEYQVCSKVDDGGSLDREDIQNWQNEIDDWRFIQRLDESISYDLAARTSVVFHSLTERRNELEEKLQSLRARPEFQDVDLSRYYQS